MDEAKALRDEGALHEPLLPVVSDKQTGIGRPEWGLGFWLTGIDK